LPGWFRGEEFVVVLPSTPIPSAIHAAEAIRENVKALKIPYENSSVNWCITISLGIAGIVPTPGHYQQY
jgi:diguanylate cyclase (GGDEF)-like protein